MATAIRRIRNARLAGRAHYGVLQQLLTKQYQVLRTRMEAVRESARAERSDVRDVEEGAVDLVDLGVGLAALELSSQIVQGIETALRRLEAGKYGICFDCEARISSVRLRAVPFAELCRGCQEQRDSPPKPTSWAFRNAQGSPPIRYEIPPGALGRRVPGDRVVRPS